MQKALNAATCKEERKGDLTHIEKKVHVRMSERDVISEDYSDVATSQGIPQLPEAGRGKRQTPCPSHTLPEPPEGK